MNEEFLLASLVVFLEQFKRIPPKFISDAANDEDLRDLIGKKDKEPTFNETLRFF